MRRFKATYQPHHWLGDDVPEGSSTASSLHELEPGPQVVNTGVLDQHGEPIRRRLQPKQIGFVLR